MIAIPILLFLLTTMWAVVNGRWINGNQFENKNLFHFISVAMWVIYTAAALVVMMLYIPFVMRSHKELLWQTVIISAGFRFLLHDGIINLIIGKSWFYIGKTALWDRLMRKIPGFIILAVKVFVFLVCVLLCIKFCTF